MPIECRPYSALADVYDHAMAHVDYDRWVDYVTELIDRFAPPRPAVLELGCGTGNITVRLAPRLRASYLATDISPEMIGIARRKLNAHPAVAFQTMDFRTLKGENRYDVVLLIYDGINYARNLEELEMTLSGTARILRPGGVFLFDQCTPANSINNLSYFDDRYTGDDFSYARTSSYDETERVHVTRFVVRKSGDVMVERHEQRAFTRKEMLKIAGAVGFEVAASLRAFEFEPAGDDTERIQWVMVKNKPATEIAGA